MIRKYINIGIAVNTTDGLVVPVIHDVDKLDVETIAEKINELSEKQKKKITIKDIQEQLFLSQVLVILVVPVLLLSLIHLK